MLLREEELADLRLPTTEIRGRQWLTTHRLQRATALAGDVGRARQLAEDLLRQAEGPLKNPWRAGLARWDLSVALRMDGRADAAEPIAEKALADARLLPRLNYMPVLISELAAVKIALGKQEEALALLEEYASRSLKDPRGKPQSPYDANAYLWRGQALLHLQRALEAREAFALADSYWRDFDPEHPMAAEAAWWYGHSLIATREAARGKAMVAAARSKLAESFLPHLRPLATAPAPIALAANTTPKAQSPAR
jgi:tetratricopeptide (TPR) repeat protein